MQHAPGFLKLVESVMPGIREITLEQWLELPKGQAWLLDVREDREWQQGYIPGALHLARGVLERDIETLIPDKASPVILYCGGGYRSALAADSLQKMGYTDVRSLAGGWRAWCQSFPQGMP